MDTFHPLLTAKLHIPAPRSESVSRPRLIERLNEGMHRKLTLVSAPAGSGKTTLLSEWLANGEHRAAWLSLDEWDNDPSRFLSCFIAALQTIAESVGKSMSRALQSPQPPSNEAIITSLLNEIIVAIPDAFVLVLDDYHVIEAKPVEELLTFLLEHLPPQMHLVLATREDPNLPLSRLRAQDELTELRFTDLRFSTSEAARFLQRTMGLDLSMEDIEVLENRTEGWIVGLQLAAISMKGQKDTASFIRSFTGSHHFVLDYLVEEVLQQLPDNMQTFLLHTSILERMCGPLCDAVSPDPSVSGQDTLEALARANLFTIPLDHERRWFRYHHLFADLLRQRLHQRAASVAGREEINASELHKRAAIWFASEGMEMEAFHHAAKARDIEFAARLVEGNGMPLHFRGGLVPVLNWLNSLPSKVLDARPSLWVMLASALSMSGQLTGVEPKLQSAEAVLEHAKPDEKTRNLTGHIAAIRALLAAVRHDAETVVTESRRALECLSPHNLAVRTATIWKLGWACQLRKDWDGARRAYTEAISVSRESGNHMVAMSAAIGLGNVQEAENELHRAAETYRNVLREIGEPPLPAACEPHLGLARIYYEWNDLDAAERHVQTSMELARKLENSDKFAASQIFSARLKLARGDAVGASSILAEADRSVGRHHFVHLQREIAETQVLVLLYQGNTAAAGQIARTGKLPVSEARVHFARGDTSAALAVLEPLHVQAGTRGWENERLRVMILQAAVLHAHGEKDKALQMLADALVQAEPEGFIRLFADEGPPMASLLSEAVDHAIMPHYSGKLLAACEGGKQTLVEPLSRA